MSSLVPVPPPVLARQAEVLNSHIQVVTPIHLPRRTTFVGDSPPSPSIRTFCDGSCGSSPVIDNRMETSCGKLWTAARRTIKGSGCRLFAYTIFSMRLVREGLYYQRNTLALSLQRPSYLNMRWSTSVMKQAISCVWRVSTNGYGGTG